MIGIWSYSDEESKTAQEISRGEEQHAATTLAQALAEVRSFLGGAESSDAGQIEPESLVERPMQAQLSARIRLPRAKYWIHGREKPSVDTRVQFLGSESSGSLNARVPHFSCR